MRYYMTTLSNSSTRAYEACKAKTLAAAKREATRELSGGFIDELITIATKDQNGIFQEIAHKGSNGWINLED